MEKSFKNLDELKEHFPNAKIQEIDSNEVGMSFEPRTQTDYLVLEGKKIIGDYSNTSVYQKDGTTLVTEFGEFVGD